MAYEGPKGPTSRRWKILVDYNFAPTQDTFCETFPVAGDIEVEKFCNLQIPMNCSFKFDPATE